MKKRVVADYVLGQRVVNIRSGFVATRKGSCLAGKNVFEVMIFGKGHEATPQLCLDPVVIAAHIIVRLQSIVSREIDPNKMALITCGSVHGGDAANTIPDKAVLKIDIRAYSQEVLQHTVASFRRVVYAECQASGDSRLPIIKKIEDVPPLMSDDDMIAFITEEFQNYFGKDRVERMSLNTAADDFGILAPEGVPYACWNFGSEDYKKWQRAHDGGELDCLPGIYSSKYAPQIQPTLETETHALALAALAFLADDKDEGQQHR